MVQEIYNRHLVSRAILLISVSFACFCQAPLLSQPKTSLTGNTYYIDADKGVDFNNGTSENTAWQTIIKINRFKFREGDKILFRRGQIFYGSLRVVTAGIELGAYGSGEKPVISGFAKLTNWVAAGKGRYESLCEKCGPHVQVVIANNTVEPMGRFPNLSAPNGGFRKITGHNGIISITDTNMRVPSNWRGAELVIRKKNWLLDKSIIQQQEGNTFFYYSPTDYAPGDGFGYFIQNHPSTLDVPGEWFYARASKKVLYFFGNTHPAKAIIQVNTVDTLIGISANNVVVRNLSLEGSGVTAIGISQSKNVEIRNVTINYSGTNAITAFHADYLEVDSCFINHSANNAIETSFTNFAAVKNSSIKNTGLLPGMGLSNNQQYAAIVLRGSCGNRVFHNCIDSTGYTGIIINGDSFTVKNNIIRNYTLTLDDGAGIYTWGDYNKSGRKIYGNLIFNGKGAPTGTTSITAAASSGIYCDDRSSGIDIFENTVEGANGFGIYLHNAHQINVRNNTLFNNNCQLFLNHDVSEPGDPIRGVVITHNILIAKTASQGIISLNSTINDIGQFGHFDSNFYARSPDTTGILTASFSEDGYHYTYHYNLQEWRSAFGFDNNSQTNTAVIATPAAKIISPNLFVNGHFSHNANGVFCLSSPGSSSVTWEKKDGGKGNLRVSCNKQKFPNRDLGLYFSLGPVKAHKDYLIRFKLRNSAVAGKMLQAFVLTNTEPFQQHSKEKFFSIDPIKAEAEYVYHSARNGEITLALNFLKVEHDFWVDYVELYETNIAVSHTVDNFLFVYNDSDIPKPVTLNGMYHDAKNNLYTSIDIAPFRSAVLTK